MMGDYKNIHNSLTDRLRGTNLTGNSNFPACKSIQELSECAQKVVKPPYLMPTPKCELVKKTTAGDTCVEEHKYVCHKQTTVNIYLFIHLFIHIFFHLFIALFFLN